MKLDNNKHILKLGDTAALVMSWSMSLYKNGLARSYVNRLDLSAGNALLMKCNEVCSWYDEVILDRKHFMRCLVENVLRSSNEGPWQIVIPAAGVSSLSLELLTGNASCIACILKLIYRTWKKRMRSIAALCLLFTLK